MQGCLPGFHKETEMGWASEYIARLQAGDVVQFRPRGNSMKGKIESGQLCTVEPVDTDTLKVGDIVLCKVNGKQYLHLVKAIQEKQFQIGNNRGRINGWVGENSIFGKCTKVE
jgi:SOS-response transcriptional repressor LexA